MRFESSKGPRVASKDCSVVGGSKTHWIKMEGGGG